MARKSGLKLLFQGEFTMKKTLALLLVLCLAAALCACGQGAAPAADSKNLTMDTGTETGTYYAFGGVLGSYISKNTDMSVNVVSSGGSAANLTGIVTDKIYDLATVQSDVMTYAYNGTNAFAESGKLDGFRVLCGLYAETVQIVTCNPDIKSVSDLKGKTVCVGDVGSGTNFNTLDILAAYDMTISDINPVYESFGNSTEDLKNGKIDAAVITSGAPTTAVTDLAQAKGFVYLISIDEAHMARLLADCPWYASYTIPGDTYKGQNGDAVTVTINATLVCRADLPDDAAYAIVSTIFDNAADIAVSHAKGAELSLDFATEGMAVPFAVGAAKFFAEKGITVATAP